MLHNICLNKLVQHTQKPFAELRELSARLITAASMGDMITCASIAERYGVGLLNTGDYDGRTPLHLACADSQMAGKCI